MTKFKDDFGRVYEAEEVAVCTTRTVDVVVTLDVSEWDEDDEPFDEDELLFAATDRWLEIVGSQAHGPDVIIEARALDRVRIVVEEK